MKSHVGMALCFLCCEPKHLIFDRRLRKSLEREAVYDTEPCDKCKEYMKQGIILISVNEKLTTDEQNPYRSGGWVVIKEEAVRRLPFDNLEPMLKTRIAFITDEAWDMVGLPRGESNEPQVPDLL